MTEALVGGVLPFFRFLFSVYSRQGWGLRPRGSNGGGMEEQRESLASGSVALRGGAPGRRQHCVLSLSVVDVLRVCRQSLPSPALETEQEEPTRLRGIVGISSRSLDDDKVGLVNTDVEEADKKTTAFGRCPNRA